MKERPILFTAPMVQAILEGRKTMTRRIVKHGQVFRFCPGGDLNKDERAEIYSQPFVWCEGNTAHPTKVELLSICPYGVTGDRLWVRETWRTMIHGTSDAKGYVDQVEYRADGNIKDFPNGEENFKLISTEWQYKWRPSIFMPRWASRITLEITDVRVERLQEISGPDVCAEGVQSRTVNGGVPLEGDIWAPHIDAFSALWDKINSKRASWESNPWVWVLSFKRMEP